MINSLVLGDTYGPKFTAPVPIKLSVGRGGDCGIYVEEDGDEVLLFRVLVNTISIKQDWHLLESGAVATELQQLAHYGEHDIGTDDFFKVTLDALEDRIPISRAEFDALERLGSYSTINILQRLSSELGLPTLWLPT